VQPDSRDLRPRKTLSWSSLPLQSRTASRLPALRCRRTHLRGRSVLSSPGIASPGVLSPLEHIDVGCPSSHPPRPLGHEDLAAAAGKVRVTRPSPVPSSGFLPLSTDLAALAARTFTALTSRWLQRRRSPWRPDASQPCSMLLAPTGVALQSFPFPRSRTRSRGPFLPCGFAQTAQRRGAVRGFRGPFRLLRRPRAAVRPKAHRTGRPGQRFPGVARAPHVSRCRGRLRRLVSERPGSPDSAARTPTSELCSPRESVRGY